MTSPDGDLKDISHPNPPLVYPQYQMTLNKHWKYPDGDLVTTNLKGLVRTNPQLRLLEQEKVVYRESPKDKVAVILGGGAGHEPLHAGYVGSNLLNAAVLGLIFALPLTRQIMAAITAVASKQAGVVLVVKNYTGDVLHFGLVCERAKAAGYKVDTVIVADDVAVGRDQNAMVGRRGLAGTALIHKVVGGAASQGYDVDKVAEIGNYVNQRLVTLGALLDRTLVPGRLADDQVEFCKDDEAELGLGIHNEPGTKIPIPEIDSLIKDMYTKLTSPDDDQRHYVNFDLANDDYVLLVNNIGGTLTLEMNAITEYAVELSPFKKPPTRVYLADFVTSLNSPGFSITILKLDDRKQEILGFLDLETDAAGWRPKPASGWNSTNQIILEQVEEQPLPKLDLRIDATKFRKHLDAALKLVIAAEPKVTHYDTVVGDGDCGETLKLGAEAVGAVKDYGDDPVNILVHITERVEDLMGGTSGGLYLIYLTALLKSLKGTLHQDVANAMKEALYDGLFKYTRAREGGRTLVDTLQPFVDTFVKTGDIKQAVEAAEKGCEATKTMTAKFGRALYVDSLEFKAEGGIPDPGAVGLLALIKGFVDAQTN